MDFVFFGLQSWDIEIGSNSKNLARELSQKHRVLYVNRALDRRTKLLSKSKQTVARKKALKSKEITLEEISHNLWFFTPATLLESINWIGSTSLHNWLVGVNSKRYAKEINKALNKLKFNNIVLINDNDFIRGQRMKDFVNPSLYVYYLRDMLSAEPYFRKHGPKLEVELIMGCHLVISNSEFLAMYAKKYNPESYSIGQGCELDSFNADKLYDSPPDIEKIDGPIVGYVGVLSSARLDIDLIFKIASKLPYISIVLVGPEDSNFAMSNLHDLDNVFFLGQKQPYQLAQYIASFDICINPQAINSLTQGNYPRKIDEYLAMGKPVIASKTAAMDMFADYVILCTGWQEYVSTIEKMLVEENNNAREKVSFAKSHSWANNANKFEKLIFSKIKVIN